MRPVECFPNSIYGFLITLALPLVGEMSTAIGFAMVPAALRGLPQPSALQLSDLPRQLVADSLMPRELNEFMQATRYEHQQLSKLRQNTNRRTPWGVQVKTGKGTTWLDPAKEEGWDQVEEILEANPRCLERTPPSGKGLLERLPLSSWKGQALQAAKDGIEPRYFEVILRLLSLRLSSIILLTAPPPSFATPRSWMVRNALTLHSMHIFLSIAHCAAEDAASQVTGAAARLAAARDAGRDSALHAARVAANDAAWNPLRDLYMGSVTYAARDAARDASWKALMQLEAQTSADAPPAAELIGKTAYRSAELAALITMLEQVEEVVQTVFARTEWCIASNDTFPMLVNPAAWQHFKDEHFNSLNENIVCFLRPWLRQVDWFLGNAAHSISAALPLESK